MKFYEQLLNLPLGLGDYIIIVVTIFFIFMLFVYIAVDAFDAVVALLFIAVLVLGIPIYLNKINGGVYLAQIKTINNMVMGEGTKESEKFNFTISDDKIKFDNSYDIYNINKTNSNFYIKAYTNSSKETIKITLMGNVSVYDNNDKKKITIKVFN